jgi:2-dehydro-3-deoxyphosphogluconate aldolase/(4S)-4-hydroxy-2-oxoglutarate aldolase
MGQDISKIEAVMTAAPVIPVLVVEDPKKAVPMAKALVRGGLPAIEITLRTPHALEAIAAVNETRGRRDRWGWNRPDASAV